MTNYSDLMVHVDEEATTPERIRVATALAERFKATLTGVYVKADALFPTYTEFQVGPDILDQIQASIDKRAEQARYDFQSVADNADVLNYWLDPVGDLVQHISWFARTKDLLILSQWQARDRLEFDPEEIDKIILGCGGPAFVIPYVGVSHAIGDHILLAWNNMRESARAVRDAMPFLKAAKKVDVIIINESGQLSEIGQRAQAELTSHLQRKEVNTDFHHVVETDLSAGEIIINNAADRGSDLIVCGAYGHSRLRETVMGGATRHLLQHMPVPVLFSH